MNTFNKRTRTLLVLGACLVLLGVPAALSVRELQEKRDVTAELSSAKARLAELSSDETSARISGLKAQLATLEAKTASLKTKLSPEITSPDVADALFAGAKTAGVALGQASASPTASGKLLDISAKIDRILISITGGVSAARAFVAELGNAYPTGVVREVNFASSNETKATGSIRFEIYRYGGDSK